MDSNARHQMSTADQLLLERGELDSLEYLLALNYLGYAEYRGWRHQRRLELQSALKTPLEEVTAALALAQAYVAAQGLTAETSLPRAWNEDQAPLIVGPSKTLTELCSKLLVRPRDRLQGDLFQDSLRTIVLNTINSALTEHRFDAARAGLVRHLGIRARDYMAPLWAELAERLENYPFSPSSPKLHASYTHMQANDWSRASAAIEAEVDSGRYPMLLVRMAEAYARQSRREAARRV